MKSSAPPANPHLALLLAALASLALGALGAHPVGPHAAYADDSATTDSAFVPDSAGTDSLRQARQDSIAVADSLARAGSLQGTLLGRAAEHPFGYTTNYGTLRNRRTWDQSLDLYKRIGNFAAANQTQVTIIQDPDIRRQTRNRSTTFEFGYIVFPGMTSGLRVAVSRNSDIIGIRQQNSIRREQDEFSAFTGFDRTVAGLPITANAKFGGVSERQPEFSRRGGDFDFDASTRSQLPGGIAWNLGTTAHAGQLRSEAPTDSGSFTSNDRTTDRTARGGLNWSPLPGFSLDLKGSSRRGVLQRPEKIFDPRTLAQTLVREQATTVADNGDLAINLRGPFGMKFTTSGTISDTKIRYAADTTRDNIALSKSFTMTGTDSLLGAAFSASFQNGLTRNDYTARSDGYLQTEWRRQADLSANRRVNARTTAEARGGVSLASRRYQDFRPSGPASFPPSDQDLLHAASSIRLDYHPSPIASTGLQGEINIDRTINLSSQSSINNADQTNYAVTWRWAITPWSFWTLTQDNSAGANEVTYPFASDRDQLSFIYQIRTSSVARLGSRIGMEMHYNLRYQSRGSFREAGTGRRLFGKAGGADQYDLLLRATYQAFTWLNFDVSQQTFVTQNYSYPSEERHVDNATTRRGLYASANASYKFAGGATLSGNLRRTLTRDEVATFANPPIPSRVTDDGFWQISGSFRTFFDL